MSCEAAKATVLPTETAAPDLLDLGGRSLLIMVMIFTAQGCWQRLVAHAGTVGCSRLLEQLSDLGVLCFALLVSVLVVVSRPPRRRCRGLGAMASALGAAFVLGTISHLPLIRLPVGVSLLSCGLLALGNIGTVYCLAHLGRSFSVLPQARALVRNGPYALVRHPLYVAEGIATLGIILAHLGVVAVAVGMLQCALQWYRLRYEETVLEATFADYAAYAAATPRFLPRLVRISPKRDADGVGVRNPD
jgi:protein-S-isoprenylcysteine O-methyltransferase Ste14